MEIHPRGGRALAIARQKQPEAGIQARIRLHTALWSGGESAIGIARDEGGERVVWGKVVVSHSGRYFSINFRGGQMAGSGPRPRQIENV